MERVKRGCRLLKKITAVVLIAALIFPVISPPKPAEAFIEEIIAAFVIAGCEITLNFLMPKLASKAGDIFESAGEAFLDDVILVVEKGLRFDLEKLLYDLDHKRLTNFRDFTPYLSDLYASAYRSDGGAFNASWNAPGFEAEHPGYRDVSPGSPAVIFSREYAKRLDAYSSGTKKVIDANRTMAQWALDTNAANPAGGGALKAAHDALMSAGELTKGGYAELADAKNHILVLTDQHTSAVRAAQTLQNDTAARVTLNELQEKSDRAAAFEQAVRRWNVSVTSAAY